MNMVKSSGWILLIACFMCTWFPVAGQAAVKAAAVTEEDSASWTRWVIPLPKEIKITGKVEVPTSKVRITLRKNAGDVEKTAAGELAKLLKQNVDANISRQRFEIIIGICDKQGRIDNMTVADAIRLKDLPNSEQAYIIQPAGKDSLILTALDERGVYYAALTLCQLLESKIASGKVTIPLVSVTDWPDMAYRGQWGSPGRYPKKEIEWMAHYKLNRVEYGISHSITDDGRGTAHTDADKIEFARRRAFRVVPHITHLNVLDRNTGGRLFRMFPELKSKGKKDYHGPLFTGEVRGGAPCPSQPKLVEILAQMMVSLAEQGAVEISGWLTEGKNHQCLCEQCMKHGRDSHYWLEACAYVEAWRLARKQYPKLELRILTTQGSYGTNNKVLFKLPPEVGVTFYSAGSTYNSRRKPQIYPLLERFAAGGGLLGSTPQLTPSFARIAPWTGPQFIRYRMNELVDKKVDCLAAYVVPGNQPYRFNVTASTEWSWNAKGRSAREFALAWATRNRIANPKAYADWAVMLGEVGWHVYGSEFLYFIGSGRISKVVTQWSTPARSRPVLGKKYTMFREFPTVEHMNRDLAACKKAMQVARRLNRADMIQETRVIEGYVKIIKEIYTLADLTYRSADIPPADEDRIVLQLAMTRLAKAGWQCADGLEKWYTQTGMKYTPGRFTSSVSGIGKMVSAIGKSLSVFGVTDPGKPYTKTDIWKWTGTDFKDSPRRTVKIEVTDKVPYESGALELVFGIRGAERGGFRIHRVTLVSAPVENPEKLTEISVDEHLGTIGHRRLYNVYRLSAVKRDPKLRYFIMADMEAVALSAIGKRKGTLSMVTVAPAGFNPDIWDKVEAGRLRPLTDEAYEQLFMPNFIGYGIRVGVVQGAHGSTSILAHLRTADGFDVQALQRPSKEAIDRCQVVVISMTIGSSGPLPQDFQRNIREFVKAGGGLVAFHLAAGYRRGLPNIPEVCVRGTRQVKHKPWIVTARHPVTNSIRANRPLSPMFSDYVVLEAGQDGQVLATSYGDSKPILITGTFGKGRYVACGLLVATDPEWEDVPPKGAERVLLENAVKWCGDSEG